MSPDRQTPTTLAELEKLRSDTARQLTQAHRSELEDADERHKARCKKLDEYFDIRSHEISSGRAGMLDTAHVWETWATEILTLAVDYSPR